MKAISLTQPYATAIMLGHKKIETRSWSSYYLGRVAIHAAKGFPKWAREFAEEERVLGRCPVQLPLGAVIGFATIVRMENTENVVSQISAIERIYGDYSPGRFAWILSDIEALPDDKIVPYKGSLGLWEFPDELIPRG